MITAGLTHFSTIGGEFDYTSLTENCGAATAVNNLNNLSTLAGYLFPLGTTTVTWTATDLCANTAQCSFEVQIYAPSIELVKTGTLNLGVVAPDGVPNVGDLITYTFSVTNTGNAPLTLVTINDPLVIVSGAPITLAPGETNLNHFTAVHLLTPADILAGTFTNIATVTGTGPLGVIVTDTDDNTQEFIFIAGNIYDDANGMNNSIISGSPPLFATGNGIWINLVNPDPDKGVVASIQVNTDGTYYFTLADGLEFNTNYTLILTSEQQAEGTILTTATYPASWVSTGEILGVGNGNDGSIDGALHITTSGGSVINANFGIDQLPVANPVSSCYANPGNTATVAVPLLSGTDAEDGLLGSGKTIVITSLATNGTLYYNGIAVTLNQVMPNYSPLLLTVDPNAGGLVIHFNYAFIDAAGMQGSSALVTLNFNDLITHPQETCSPDRVDLTSAAVTAGSSFNGVPTFSYWMDLNASIVMPNPTTAYTGTYYIMATTNAGCSTIKPVTVIVHSLPTIYTVSGSGGYCAGGAGREITMSNSQPGVIYTLRSGCCYEVGIPVVGTGSAISFGYHTLPGLYSIHAKSMTTHCVNWMFNCVYIWIDQPVPASVAVHASANPVPVGTEVTFTAIPVNGGTTPIFQWTVNGLSRGTNHASFAYIPINGDEVTCIVTSNAYCVSGNPAISSVIMDVTGIAPVTNVSGIVFTDQVRCFSASQTLIVAGGGNTFTVGTGGSATMIAGQNIRCLPGTTVQPGGYMRGYITINSQYCGQLPPAIPTVTTGNDSEPLVVAVPSDFFIYPNPTNGNFTLEQNRGKVYEKVQVMIYGTRGEQLMTGAMIGEKKHEFQVSELPTGLYFVKIIADGYVEVIKLVKTR